MSPEQPENEHEQQPEVEPEPEPEPEVEPVAAAIDPFGPIGPATPTPVDDQPRASIAPPSGMRPAPLESQPASGLGALIKRLLRRG